MYCFYMVGMSGAGKSTLSKKLAEKYGAIVLSSDELRRELYGDPRVQKNPSFVFTTLKERAAEALKAGKSIVVDSTGLRKKNRLNFLEYIKDIDCNKCCVVFDVSIEDCIRRDRERDRTVGEHIINMQFHRYEKPDKSEGWDEIIRYTI